MEKASDAGANASAAATVLPATSESKKNSLWLSSETDDGSLLTEKNSNTVSNGRWKKGPSP